MTTKDKELQTITATLEELETALKTAHENIQEHDAQVTKHMQLLEDLQEQDKALEDKIAEPSNTVEDIVAISAEKTDLALKISAQRMVVAQLQNRATDTIAKVELTPVAKLLKQARVEFAKYNKEAVMAVSINTLQEYKAEMAVIKTKLTKAESLFNQLSPGRGNFVDLDGAVTATNNHHISHLDKAGVALEQSLRGALELPIELFK